jgi:UDP-N-acetylmuramoyl-L-alanyl-D-glutamate--2,6-diaminopimelate ligase
MSITPLEFLARIKDEHGDDIGVCEHTDDLGEKDIFIASDKASAYIPAALDKGAIAVVCASGSVDSSHTGKVVEVDDVRQFAYSLVQAVYGNDIAQVDLVGITGTNGKTSTAHFACQLFGLLGESAGYIGTLGYGVVSEGLVAGRNTTPDVVTLYRYISLLYRRGCRHVVMEVSSHALALNRIEGLDFSIGMFTNLSRDHLDFHGSMEAYEKTKLSFFEDYRVAHWIINADYPAGGKLIERKMAQHDDRFTSYGMHEAKHGQHFSCRFMEDAAHASSMIELTKAGHSELIKAGVSGQFNLENMVAAILVCHVSGYQLTDVAIAAASVKAVPGRMECVVDRKGVKVCVDYAHTPAGIDAVMGDHMLHAGERGKVWCIFGCGGDRDRGKRPIMGRSAASHSQRVILTDDNVRGDQAEEIICDVLAGIEDKTHVIVCRDRRKAIGCVLDSAIRNDLVLLLGKGNESTITYGNHRLSHRDMDAVMQHVSQQ